MDFSTNGTQTKIKTADYAIDAGDTAKYTDSILIIPRKVYCNIRLPKIWVILNACVNSVIQALF